MYQNLRGVRDPLLQAGSGTECRELIIPDSNLASETYCTIMLVQQQQQQHHFIKRKGDFERMEVVTDLAN